MSIDVLMPQLGETTAEGKITAWFKAEGDQVNEGDDLFEVETDKASMDVQAIASGVLGAIRVQVGDVVKVGSVVAVLGEAKTAAAAPAAKAAPDERPAPASAAPTRAAVATKPAPVRSPFEEVSTPTINYGQADAAGVRISPLARRMIAQSGLDVASIARAVSAGGRSRITRQDVEQAQAQAPSRPLQPPAAAAPTPLPPGARVVELNTIRKRTGERLQRNWQTIPHVFQAIDIDFTAVEAERSKRKEAFKRDFGVPLTYLPFVARSVALALAQFPQVNAHFAEDGLRLFGEVNLGIAVDLSHNGLVVPVLRRAEDLTVAGLAKAIGQLVQKARSGKLSPDDMSGGTYSISNNGAFGTAFTSPIINAPQVAILSFDAVRLRPAVVETAQGSFVAARLTGTVGQSFDHRAFDGAYSAAFLSKLKTIIEEREWAGEFA